MTSQNMASPPTVVIIMSPVPLWVHSDTPQRARSSGTWLLKPKREGSQIKHLIVAS